MNKKYELTDKTFEVQRDNDEPVTLYRIKALRDFGRVKAGDIGGWIEKEDNLSHEGNCWINDDAMVYDNALVFGKAKVLGYAKIANYVIISGTSCITGKSVVD